MSTTFEHHAPLVVMNSEVDPNRLGEQAGHLSFDELRSIDAASRLVLSL